MKVITTERYDAHGNLIERVTTTEYETPAQPMVPYIPYFIPPPVAPLPCEITYPQGPSAITWSANC
jgi:hypothetical protein